uniref:DDE_3 domain-containing protein n=1 Tax=Haemonchus contortus TaxID=6289 RepID=A0A7I4Y142_HAECO
MLTERMKKTRLERCKKLLKRFSQARHTNILFTDECLFSTDQFLNTQNDRIIAGSPAEASQHGGIAQRSGHPKSLMVFGAITSDGKMPLIFLEKGVKVDSKTYLKSVLEKEVLPWAQSHFGNRTWTYQQDSAPAHRSKVVQDWCATHFPDFISSKDWSPNSPDLNPLDYSVWSVLKRKACSTQHRSLDALRATLVKAWEDLDEDYLRAAVERRRHGGSLRPNRRLSACIRAKGGYFEI